MKTAVSWAALGAIALAASASASQHVIRQKGRVFSAEEITVKAGTSVLFVNDDDVPHNVVSTTPGNTFNIGSQPPNTSTPVTFAGVGEVRVICAIHPRMKLTVRVTE